MQIPSPLPRLFSTLFHPMLMPTLGVFVLFQLNTYVAYSVSDQARRFIMLMIFMNTAIAPVLSVFILQRTGHVKDVALLERSERIFPLMIASLMFFLTYYLLRQISLPSLVYFYLMGGTLLVLIALTVSFFWKISLHMMGLGGFTGFLIVVSLLLRTELSWLLVSAILASGLTASARLLLGAHTPAQVYAGYLLGLGAMLLLYACLSG